MRFVKTKAIDASWMTLRIAGQLVKGKTHSNKMTRKRTKVIRYGSDVAEAQTRGIAEADPTSIEFDLMGAMTIMQAFGVVDGNALATALKDRVFEIVENVRDPDISPFGAGGLVSSARGCQVDGVEWKHEVGENASTMTWTISIIEWNIAAHDLGGGGFTV